jgi:hypothetical protein
MRKLILVSVLVLSSLCFLGFVPKENEIVYKTEFCQGFEDGYCEGYKDVKGPFVVCPVPPVCPVPGVGIDTYKGGYNTGFKAGMRKANER